MFKFSRSILGSCRDAGTINNSSLTFSMPRLASQRLQKLTSRNMGSEAKPWREASALFSVAKNRAQIDKKSQTNPEGTQFSFKLLMEKRIQTNPYLPDEHFVPGGLVQSGDHDPKWMDLFQSISGVSADALKQQLHVPGDRPAMITSPVTCIDQSAMPTDVAYRITAIREAFQKTGLFVMRGDQKSDYGVLSLRAREDDQAFKAKLGEWRNKVIIDGSYFFEMCESMQVVPNVWGLVEWSNWLTPPNLDKTEQGEVILDARERSNRLDCLYYMCFVDDTQTFAAEENSSGPTKPEWHNPKDLLHRGTIGKTQLSRVLAYELSRMSDIDGLNDLKQFATEREASGVTRNLDKMIRLNDGDMFVLPGDDYYPPVPGLLMSGNQMMRLDRSVKECLEEDGNKHRMVRPHDAAPFIECNVDLPNDHHRPSLPNLLEIIQKMDLELKNSLIYT